MKKILLISDTHGYLDNSILEHASKADEIWHAGDIGNIEIADRLMAVKPLRAVYGNIDDTKVRTVYPLNNRFIVEGLDVLITHIGGYPGRYHPSIKGEIEKNPPRLFICGHSHILKVMKDARYNLLHINPGAAGIYGFHKMRTMIRFQIANGKIENLDVIELGLRGTLAQSVG